MKESKTITSLVLLFVIWLAVLAGVSYLGVYLCAFRGIVVFIDGIKSTPVSSVDIATGIVRFIATWLVVWLNIAAGIILTDIVKVWNSFK